jgi:hypothetical protein
LKFVVGFDRILAQEMGRTTPSHFSALWRDGLGEGAGGVEGGSAGGAAEDGKQSGTDEEDGDDVGDGPALSLSAP